MKNPKITFALLFSLIVFVSCKNNTPAAPTGLVTEKAMVVSAREEASKIGVAILEKGGNAFDAMVAMEMSLVIAYPFAGSIGGGGFMVYRKADGEVGGIDYREKAPLSAHKDMYLDSLGNVIPDMSTKGATAVGVPGTVAGIIEVHKKFGVLPLAEILAPVITLAETGIVATEKQVKRFKNYEESILEVNGGFTTFPINCIPGDTLKNYAFANTLRKIAKDGRDGFYKGETAQKLAALIQEKRFGELRS